MIVVTFVLLFATVSSIRGELPDQPSPGAVDINNNLPVDIGLIILQYLNPKKSFGCTNKHNRALLRQFDLCQISKSFESLTARAVITTKIIHDEFNEITNTPPGHNFVDQRLLDLPIKRVRMMRTINHSWSRLVMGISALCSSRRFYLIFLFRDGDPLRVWGFDPLSNRRAILSVEVPIGVLPLLEQLYRGKVIRTQLLRTNRKTEFLQEHSWLCAREGAPGIKRMCLGIKVGVQMLGSQLSVISKSKERELRSYQCSGSKDMKWDIVMLDDGV